MSEAITKDQHFNSLTASEAEALALLSEECGEVVQVIGKILRHGLYSFHPHSPGISNHALLIKELGDVLAAVQILGLPYDEIDEARTAKLAKVGQFLHHATVPYDVGVAK